MDKEKNHILDLHFFQTPFGDISSYKNTIIQQINKMNEMWSVGVSCYCFESDQALGETISLAGANHTFFRCIGHTKEQFEQKGNNLKQIVFEEDWEKAEHLVRNSLANPDEVIPVNYRIVSYDGEEFLMLCKLKSIVIEENKIILICLHMDFNHDIKLQKMILDKMKEQEEKNEQLKWMMDEVPCGIALFRGDDEWTLIQGNAEFFRPVGYTEDEVSQMDQTVRSIIYEKDASLLLKAQEEARSRGSSSEYEIRMIAKNGEVKWFVTKIKLYFDSVVPYFLVVNWDINERKNTEQELHLQTERYELVENINDEMAFDINVLTKKMLMPKKYSILCGEKDREDYLVSIQDSVGKYIYADDFEMFCSVIEEASQEEKKGVFEYRLNIAKQEDRPEYSWHRTYYKSILGINGRVIRILGRTSNINGEKLEQNKLAEKLKIDSLTGILNKAAIRDEIESFLAGEKKGVHAAFLIDIDNFKMINDTFGHMFGDTVLINIAEKLSRLYRSTDIVGRIGGDEFFVLMKYTNLDQIKEKASVLCDTIKQVYKGEAGDVTISCSIGIALYNRDGSDYSTLFQKADLAMYQAKESGKNRYKIVEPSRISQVVKRINNEERGGQYFMSKGQDEDFIVVAFNLLSHAKDLDSSINILMERIGRRYHLGRVALLEHFADNRQLLQTNCWTKENGISDKVEIDDEYECWERCFQAFDERKLMYFNDCLSGTEVAKEDQEIFRERGFHALVNCGFTYNNGRDAYISFCDMERPRQWTDFEKETFLEITHILSVFVALRVQREEDKKAIRNLKKRDPLTGIYNEIVFKDQAKKIISHWNEKFQYAIVFSDINDFSYVNENFGHDAGNRILIDYAKQISGSGHMLSCRLYSDLFITLAWEEDKDTILKNTALRSQSFVEEQKKKYPNSGLHLSTGIYFIEDKKIDLEIAIENANLTRKSIKRENNVYTGVYKKELRLQRELEKRVASEFQKVLKDKCINVYLQPKFLLKEKKLCGAEALARWEDAKGQKEAPSVFIPVLEKLGYIVELDFYVFEQILIYMDKWRDEGKELPVISINFSRKHFEDEGIYHRICSMVEVYQIPHKYIEIEITESLLVMGIELVKEEMELLRKAGFRVAIDDFGTGYSSLNMLLDIPADIVKIDKSFLNRKNFTTEKEFIVKMGALIRSVKEEVIFEGIETEEQATFLVECGFRFGQGFLFDKPIPIGMFEEKYMK